MTVILRHRPSGFYYRGPQCWVREPRQAFDLRTIEQAAEAASEEILGGMEVVASFGEPECDLVLPLRHARTSRDTATLGPSEAVPSLPPSSIFGGAPLPPNLSAPELS